MCYCEFDTADGNCFKPQNKECSLLSVLTHILLHIFDGEGGSWQFESQALHLCDTNGVVEAVSL